MSDRTLSTTKHPAKFSDPILDVLGRLVKDEQTMLGRLVTVLDPFAGVGRVHKLASPMRVETTAIEIEHEWASMHAATICADSFAWMRERAKARSALTGSVQSPFDLIVTSPTYGNRLADSHNAQDGSVRRSYTHDLGRPVSPGSTADKHWGSAYWEMHAEAYRLMLGVLAPGGLALVNVSNFFRNKVEVPAIEWHRGALFGAGFVEGGRARVIETQRMTYGENRERSAGEVILRMRRPS